MSEEKKIPTAYKVGEKTLTPEEAFGYAMEAAAVPSFIGQIIVRDDFGGDYALAAEDLFSFLDEQAANGKMIWDGGALQRPEPVYEEATE